MIGRREFITLLGGAATWPLSARAQQGVPVIGFLHSGSASVGLFEGQLVAFREGLKEGGYIVGQNVAIEYHWADGNIDRMPELAADLVRRNVRVIAAPGGPPSNLAAKNATSTIPVVFVTGADPVKVGLVTGKRLELLREIMPSLRQLAIMATAGYPAALLEMAEVQATAHTLGLEVVTLEIRRAEDIAPAFEALKGRAQALYVCADSLVTTNRVRIN